MEVFIKNSERGFTLIELLTVIFLLGILSYLSMTAFEIYRSNAAYASVETTLHNAQNGAEASQVDQNNLPPSVPWYFQNTQGPILDPAAEDYLVGVKLPSKTCMWAFYNPGCADAACLSDLVFVAHCMAKESAEWVRWGDGWGTTIRHIPGDWSWCC